VENELNKRRVATTYQFGERLAMEESQWLELKSNRNAPPMDEPPSEPFPHSKLRKSIKMYITKYAAAFLNGQCVSPSLNSDQTSTSTLIFGVHDDGIYFLD